MNFKGKSFLKLLDFTPEEINYLIDFAAELKAKKKNGEAHRFARARVSLSCLIKQVPVPVAHLRWRRQTSECTPFISIPQARR